MSRVGSVNGGFSGFSSFGKPGTSGNRAYFGQKMWYTAGGGTTYNFYSSNGDDARDYSVYYSNEGWSVPWVVPDGVTSISIVTIGAGGGCCTQQAYVISSGGGGGGLAYENNVSVTPGETLYLTYGRGRAATSFGGYSAASVVWRGGPFTNGSQILCGATGGGSGSSPTASPNCTSIPGNGGRAYIPGIATTPSTWSGGDYVTAKRTGSGTTGTGGYGQGGQGGGGKGAANGTSQPMYGGGGAGGYSGTGGQGAGNYGNASAGANGGGGGGGKGTTNSSRGGAGGGTSPYGNIVGNGAAGANGTPGTAGGGGQLASIYNSLATQYNGKYFGGGGGGVLGNDFPSSNYSGTMGAGGNGVIRIIWPGTSRSFPSTNTQDV